MPDAELPEHLKDSLAAALTAGAPLRASLPSQARYAKQGSMGGHRALIRPRVLALAATCGLALVLVAFAGPKQPREWIIQSVGNVAHVVGAPLGPSSKDPNKRSSHGTSPIRPASGPTSNSTKAAESPEPVQSPVTSPPPENDEPSPSPTAAPSEGGGSPSPPSPSPSPSPTDSGSSDGDGP
jgi:hypothetical protein